MFGFEVINAGSSAENLKKNGIIVSVTAFTSFLSVLWDADPTKLCRSDLIRIQNIGFLICRRRGLGRHCQRTGYEPAAAFLLCQVGHNSQGHLGWCVRSEQTLQVPTKTSVSKVKNSISVIIIVEYSLFNLTYEPYSTLSHAVFKSSYFGFPDKKEFVDWSWSFMLIP